MEVIESLLTFCDGTCVVSIMFCTIRVFYFYYVS